MLPRHFHAIACHLMYLDILIPVEFAKLVASESAIGKKAWVKRFLEALSADDVDNPPQKLLKKSPNECSEEETTEHQLFQILLSSWIGHKALLSLIRLGKRLMLNEDHLKVIGLATPVETKMMSTQNHIELLVPQQMGKIIQYAVEHSETVVAEESSQGIPGLDANDFSVGHIFFHWGAKYPQAQDVCIVPYKKVAPDNIPKQVEVSSFHSETLTPDFLYAVLTWREGEKDSMVRVSGALPTMMLTENASLRPVLYYGLAINSDQINHIMGCLSLASIASEQKIK